MSPFQSPPTEDGPIMTYSQLLFSPEGILEASAQCNICDWRIELKNVNSLKHLADIEDMEERAQEHEDWHLHTMAKTV